MSSLQRNVAGQNIGYQLNTTSGTGVTAGLGGNVVIDGGSQTACAGTFTSKGGGQINYAPTQAETNGANVSFQFTGTSAIPVVVNLYTDAGVGIKKNVALNGFVFGMTDSTFHNPLTGLGGTITSQVSINGAAFTATANSASEIADGLYTINLAASDLNGSVIALLFTAVGADNLSLVLVTTP